MLAVRYGIVFAVCTALLCGSGCEEKKTTRATIEGPGGDKYEFKMESKEKLPD